MRILIFVFLLLALICSSTVLAKSSENVKRIQGEYETVIHLDSTEYNIVRDYKNDIEVMQGINAGEKYLFLWDLYTVYVYDIHSYQLLGKLQPKYRPVSVVDFKGKIYCACDDRLLVYDTFEQYDEYTIISVFTSLADYKIFLNSGHVRRWPRIPQKVTQLFVRNKSMYFVFFQDFLNFENEMVVEEDKKGQKFIFPRKPLKESNRPVRQYLSQEGNIITVNKSSNNSPYFITYSGCEGKILKQFKLNPPNNSKENFDCITARYLFEYLDNNYLFLERYNTSNLNMYKGLILEYNKNTKRQTEIELPFRNLYHYKWLIRYQTNYGSSLFIISINSNLSVDVLKVEVSKYEEK